MPTTDTTWTPCLPLRADRCHRWADGSRRLAGHQEIRARHAELFASAPDVHANISGRLRAGEWTVDEEHIQQGDSQLHVLVGYRVRDDLIDLVVMLRTD